MIGEEFEGVLADAQAGSEAAFSRLWRDGNPALLRYLHVTAPGAAEDVAADAWVSVVRGLATFRGDEKAWRAWLFTLARRRAIDEGRRRGRRQEVPLADLPPEHPRAGAAAADAADVALERIGTRAALALLSTLPALQAEVIALRVIAGLDTDAVARMVGRSPGAVRVASHRGLRRLAQVLSDAGVTL